MSSDEEWKPVSPLPHDSDMWTTTSASIDSVPRKIASGSSNAGQSDSEAGSAGSERFNEMFLAWLNPPETSQPSIDQLPDVLLPSSPSRASSRSAIQIDTKHTDAWTIETSEFFDPANSIPLGGREQAPAVQEMCGQFLHEEPAPDRCKRPDTLSTPGKGVYNLDGDNFTIDEAQDSDMDDRSALMYLNISPPEGTA